MFSLAWALLVVACGAAPSQVASSEAAPVASSQQPAAGPRARATRCSASPGTVYGSEPVSFKVEGEGAPDVALEATLYDRAARVVARTTTRVPGHVQLPDVPSGDFSLSVGAERVSCVVTVNRELSREGPGRN